jgi:2-methylfumaryl-CoA isomerase
MTLQAAACMMGVVPAAHDHVTAGPHAGDRGGAPAAADDPAPLAGLRIVEVSSFVAAPLGGMTLAQLGADVVRIDPVGGGPDATRWPLAANGGSLYWAGLNKGKRSVTVDFRSPDAQRAVADLIADSGPDGGIILTNAGYPWLSYAALRERRPDLIHLAITGRPDGSTSVDYTVNAAIGFPLVTGPEEISVPVNHVLPAWDVACGLYAAVGLLAAERHRSRTGTGRAITLPLSDVALAVTGHLGYLAEAQIYGAGRPRIGNHLYGSFARDFKTKSGDRVMVVTLTARHYADLVRITGRADALGVLEQALGADFRRDGDRYAHREVIAALLAPWFAERSTDEVTAALSATTVLWERYRTFADVAADPATLANPLVRVIDQPGIGLMLATGTPLAQPGVDSAPRPAPVLGADTAAVLGKRALCRKQALRGEPGGERRGVEVDDVPGDAGQAGIEAAAAADHGDPDAPRREAGGRLAEDPVTRSDHHVIEPRGDVLVLKDVDECQVRPVLAGPHPVPGVRPPKRRGDQAAMARRHHHQVIGAQAQPGQVLPLHLTDQVKAQDGVTGQVLDVNHMQGPVREPPARALRRTQLPGLVHLDLPWHGRTPPRRAPVQLVTNSRCTSPTHKSMREPHGWPCSGGVASWGEHGHRP